MTRQALKSDFETAVLLESFDGGVAQNAPPLPLPLPKEALPPVTGVHPAVIKIALSAVAWFLAVAWLDFSGGPEVDLVLAVVTGLFIMFFTLILLTASMVISDPRWKQPKVRFSEFLNDEVPVDGGTMRGGDVLIHIALLPVCLAIAATLIGLVWSTVHLHA
jgi:hypothetical protein